MSGPALTAASTMMCPHGGQVQVVPSNLRAKADAYLLTQSDTFVVAGCAFTIPPSVPSPCIKVQWIVADTSVKAGGNPTLSQSDTGLCLNAQQAPQGPVTIANTQSRVKTR
jgi:hypothetical protein